MKLIDQKLTKDSMFVLFYKFKVASPRLNIRSQCINSCLLHF
jgi:hypothetical protein